MGKHVLGNLTSNGETAALSVPTRGQGYGTFGVQGTFDSGTVSLEASFDGGSNYVTLADSSLTESGAKGVQLISDEMDPIKIRMDATGAGGSLDVTGYIYFEDYQ